MTEAPSSKSPHCEVACLSAAGKTSYEWEAERPNSNKLLPERLATQRRASGILPGQRYVRGAKLTGGQMVWVWKTMRRRAERYCFTEGGGGRTEAPPESHLTCVACTTFGFFFLRSSTSVPFVNQLRVIRSHRGSSFFSHRRILMLGFYKDCPPPRSDSLIASSLPVAVPSAASAADRGLEEGGEPMREWVWWRGWCMFLETCQLSHHDPSGCLSSSAQLPSCPVQEHAQSSQVTGSYWGVRSTSAELKMKRLCFWTVLVFVFFFSRRFTV